MEEKVNDASSLLEIPETVGAYDRELHPFTIDYEEILNLHLLPKQTPKRASDLMSLHNLGNDFLVAIAIVNSVSEMVFEKSEQHSRYDIAAIELFSLLFRS